MRGVIVKLYNATHWFSDKDAWMLFRLAAFAEAIGWTLLISAILYRHLSFEHADVFISISGRIHGLFFALYFVAVLLLARSMEWKGWRMLWALGAGVPPYGSLVFEKITAYQRKRNPAVITKPKNYDE